MGISNIVSVGKSLALVSRNFVVQNSPAILSSIAVIGTITTAVSGISATPEALKMIEKKEWEETEKNPSGERVVLSKPEIVKLVFPLYIPTILNGALTISAIIGAQYINAARLAAIGGAYSIAETTLKKYQEKLIETMGKGKETKIREAIAEESITANPLEKNTVIITNKGKSLCYDSLSGRYFESDLETIRQIVNQFNKELMTEMFKSLNEFYAELGLEQTDLGNGIGWSIDHGFLDIKYTAKLTPENTPCVVLDYMSNLPRPAFA